MSDISPDESAVFNRKSVRRALKDWHDVQMLGKHPLAQLQVVRRRRQEAAQPYADSPAGQGLVLRQLLADLLAEMKPVGENRDFSQPRWRYFFMLREQFVNGRRAQAIREEMGVSESGYFTDQRQALAWLGSRLRELEEAARSRLTVLPSLVTASSGAAPARLPTQLTPFIGREAERVRIADLLSQETCRLLTLVGPGGMGKTRLAVQVAEEQQGHFPMGIFFVPLAPLETADLVAPTIAKSIGLAFERPQDSGQQLFDFLREKHLLLILDNFEHLAAATDLVAEILLRTVRMKLIVTSRERLNLRGEWVIDMEGLQFPNCRVDEAINWQDYSAIQLFLATAERVQGGRPLPVAEYPSVVRICRLAHGLPLAIELAASWVHLLPCQEVATEIEKNLDFLDGPFRDLPERHQSLRAVFHHSWRLLSPSEQGVFRRLSLFRGSFTRETAQAVAGASLVALQQLVNKSLLLVRNGRYSIHELLRQYAAEALKAEVAEYQQTEAQHAAYFLTFLQGKKLALQQGHQQKETLAVIEQEMEEIRGAWQWAINNQQAALILPALIPLYLLYVMHNHWREGEETIGRIGTAWPRESADMQQARCIALTLAIQARFRFKMGHFDQSRHDFQKALVMLTAMAVPEERAWVSLLAIQAELPSPFTPQMLYEDCLTTFRQNNDLWGLATAHYELGAYIYATGTARTQEVRTLVTQSLQGCETIGDDWGAAVCLHHLGHIALGLGHYDVAQQRTEQSLRLYEQIGDHIGVAAAYSSLGQIAGTEGAYGDARQYYEHCLHIRREYGNRKQIAECLDSLGYITYLQSDDVQAERYYQESLKLSQEIGDQHGIAWSLHNLGDIARLREEFDRAKELYSESQRLHKLLDAQAWGRVVAMEKLGQVTFALGEVVAAKGWLLEALQIAVRTQQLRTAVDTLWSISKILLVEGELKQALVVLKLILQHHATAQEVRQLAAQQLAALTGQVDEALLVEVETAAARATIPTIMADLFDLWREFYGIKTTATG
jgi:predicted ATPase